MDFYEVLDDVLEKSSASGQTERIAERSLMILFGLTHRSAPQFFVSRQFDPSTQNFSVQVSGLGTCLKLKPHEFWG